MGKLKALLVSLALTLVAASQPSYDYDYDTQEGIKCHLGNTHAAEDTKFQTVDFDFWYAIGTNNTDGSIDALKMFKLEQLLYTAIKEDVLWCTEIKDQVVGAETEEVRRLGVVAYSPGNVDKQTEFNCPSSVAELMSSAQAYDCTVVRGEMRIFAHSVDDLSFAIAGLRDGLEEAMLDGIGQKGEISDVVFLSYLTENEAQSGGMVGGGGGFVPLKGNDTQDDDENSLSLILGLGIPMLAALFGAALLISKKRKTVPASAYRDQEHPACFVVGTGDPPGGFHEGLYHYMRNGQRYISTQCEDCLETKRNCFYSLDSVDTFESEKMGTIVEDEIYGQCVSYDDAIIRADSSLGLAQHHMGMNVRKCNSILCKWCRHAPQTTFVPSAADQVSAIESLSIGNVSTSDLLSLFTDVQSTLPSTRHEEV